QHDEAHAADLRMAAADALCGVLRAQPAESPARNHRTGDGAYNVLSLDGAGCVEDHRHRGSDVLVLQRNGIGGVRKAAEQRLLPRRGFPLREPIRYVRAELEGTRRAAQAGDSVSKGAKDAPDDPDLYQREVDHAST